MADDPTVGGVAGNFESRDGSTDEERSELGAQLAAVSTAVVRVFKDQFGRGPTKVRSHFAGPDLLLCVLENSFTPAERKLAEMGEHHRLRDLRLVFQYASEDHFKQPIEEITGREVTSFLSATDTRTDVSVEMFVLGPPKAPKPKG
jgi:uncharacterized protein YbcI